MPIVKVYVGLNAGQLISERTSDREFDDALLGELLGRVCAEIVPAALDCESAPLSPGSIQFIVDACSSMLLTVDVFIEIKAVDKKDRRDKEERAQQIKDALSEIFPQYTFAVWITLAKAGYASDSTSAKQPADMTMPTAILRARQAISGNYQ